MKENQHLEEQFFPSWNKIKSAEVTVFDGFSINHTNQYKSKTKKDRRKWFVPFFSLQVFLEIGDVFLSVRFECKKLLEVKQKIYSFLFFWRKNGFSVICAWCNSYQEFSIQTYDFLCLWTLQLTSEHILVML